MDKSKFDQVVKMGLAAEQAAEPSAPAVFSREYIAACHEEAFGAPTVRGKLVAPPVTAKLSEDGEVPLLCEMATCESCTRTDAKARAILAVHDELGHALKGVPSCCLTPYPLHRGTSHSWACDAATNAVLRVNAELETALNAANKEIEELKRDLALWRRNG